MDFSAINAQIAAKIKEQQLLRESTLCKFATKDCEAVRQRAVDYSVIRAGFRRDCEAVINLKQFNRYANKTQVFSLHKNNDISNRSYHAQLVSRIARTIGEALGLNLDLIEAISLAHDLGHTPFGHAGEKFLGENSVRFGYHFMHHVQSARYLFEIAGNNISAQVIDGVLGHNGERLRHTYTPQKVAKGEEFAQIKRNLQACYDGTANDDMLMPTTLEGCLVRICDIIAYLGKDRQDAEKLGLIKMESDIFSVTAMGARNRDFIATISADIINNSYGKDEIKISPEVFDAINIAKGENYKHIYLSSNVGLQHGIIRLMFAQIFDFLYRDITIGNNKVMKEVYLPYTDYTLNNDEYTRANALVPERIVCDFIASMCDDYFVSFYKRYQPQNPDWTQELVYTDYFDNKIDK